MREHGAIVPVPVRQVVRLEARVQDLLTRLDPSEFVRIHRSHAVNWGHVRALARGPGGRLIVVLSDGALSSRARPLLHPLVTFSPRHRHHFTLIGGRAPARCGMVSTRREGSLQLF